MSASDTTLRKHVALALQAHQTVFGPDYEGMAAAAIRSVDAYRAGEASAHDIIFAPLSSGRPRKVKTVRGLSYDDFEATRSAEASPQAPGPADE